MNHFCVCVCVYIYIERDFIRLFFPYVTFVFVYGRERKNDDVLLREKRNRTKKSPDLFSKKKEEKDIRFFSDLIVFELHFVI